MCQHNRTSFFFWLMLSSKCMFFFKKIEVQLAYNAVLLSAVQQSDSVIHLHILFYILRHYGLSQDVEYSSLCSKVGPCCFSIFYIIVCIC